MSPFLEDLEDQVRASAQALAKPGSVKLVRRVRAGLRAAPIVAAAGLAVAVFAGAIVLLRHGAGERSLQTAGTAAVPSMNGNTSPFGALAVGRAGRLYIVDEAHDRIDVASPAGSRWRWSTLAGSAHLGVTSIAIQGQTVWFAATDGVYRTTLAGGRVQLVDRVSGVTEISALRDGSIYYVTLSGHRGAENVIYLRTPAGKIRRVAGGGSLTFGQERDGQRLVAWPLSLGGIAAISPQSFYFINLSDLDLATGGRAYILTPRLHFGNGATLGVAADGTVYAVGNGSLSRVTGRRYTTLFSPLKQLPGGQDEFATPVALAVSPSGGFYVSFSVGKLPPEAGIVELSHTGRLVRIALTRATPGH
jgi:hypothetical protein